MNFQLLLRRVYPGDAVTSVGTLPTTFNPFRIPVALSTKGEDRTIVRARQMLAEAQARRDNGTSCSYIGHNSSREMSDILTSVKKKEKKKKNIYEDRLESAAKGFLIRFFFIIITAALRERKIIGMIDIYNYNY